MRGTWHIVDPDGGNIQSGTFGDERELDAVYEWYCNSGMANAFSFRVCRF